jgi:hypothetical protein
MKRTTVESSNLHSVGYDTKTHILEIQFNNGAVYQYFQVPQEVYVNLMTAESHEEYFDAVIRDRIQYQQVGYEPIQPNFKIDSDEIDVDFNSEEDDLHNPDFGEWIDLGDGERFWNSYLDQ